MWKLQSIYAKNLCSFKDLNYNVEQGQTTLIFGNNMDNESQGSNGSGKSTLLEAIAIGLTGESLRKVNTEEIINDSEDNAIVELTLCNNISEKTVVIIRRFSRKGSQSIQILIADKDKNQTNHVCSSVLEYNKFILETIGVTKEDLFSTFILSKHKYNSFLSASDKEKKEIINRFSNGNIIDNSIAVLQEDIKEVNSQIHDKELTLANLSGKINAYKEQIEEAIQDIDKQKRKREQTIQEWSEAISKCRATIRETNERIIVYGNKLDLLDDLDEKIQKLEQSDIGVDDCYNTLCKMFVESEIPTSKFHLTINDEKENLKKHIETCELLKQQIKEQGELVNEHETYCKLIRNKAEKTAIQNESKQKEIREQIQTATSLIKKCNEFMVQFESKKAKIKGQISRNNVVLSDVIVCPKCKHEFFLDAESDVEEIKDNTSKLMTELQNIEKQILEKEKEIECANNDYLSLSKEMSNIQSKEIESHSVIMDEQSKLDVMSKTLVKLQMRFQTINGTIEALNNSISRARINLFDDAYDLLDSAVRSQENALKSARIDIKNSEKVIESYESAIKEMQNVQEDDSIASIQEKLDMCTELLTNENKNKEELNNKWNELKIQESTFVEFKTHLANTKIDALSHITNEFLEAIGSDLRIVFSGFTVLKSGKIRDKISISLIRDGVDCGSFDKHSEGEKARVNLASILAMHKLTNMNCDDEKGLDLLVLDEILEATDEQGLSNIFNALNKLKITSLIVSHGQLAENYPYKVVVNKQNGVSFIND